LPQTELAHSVFDFHRWARLNLFRVQSFAG